MNYCALHFHVRNDMGVRVIKQHFFVTQDEAIDYLVEKMFLSKIHGDSKQYFLSEFSDTHLSDEKLDIIRNHLSEGYSIWKWEWVRKGNGDYFQVLEMSNNKLSFNDFNDVLDLYVLDDILKDE